MDIHVGDKGRDGQGTKGFAMVFSRCCICGGRSGMTVSFLNEGCSVNKIEVDIDILIAVIYAVDSMPELDDFIMGRNPIT